MASKIRENRETGCTAESAVVVFKMEAESAFDEAAQVFFPEKKADSAVTFLQ